MRGTDLSFDFQPWDDVCIVCSILKSGQPIAIPRSNRRLQIKFIKDMFLFRALGVMATLASSFDEELWLKAFEENPANRTAASMLGI